MTKEMIKTRIETLEEREFMIEMADFLTYEEKEVLRSIKRELKELKEELDK